MKTISRSAAILALSFFYIPVFAQVYHSVNISGSDVICGNGQEFYTTDYSGSATPTWSISLGDITSYGQNNSVWVKWKKSGTLNFHAEEIISEIITDPPTCYDEQICDYDYEGQNPFNCRTIQICDNPQPYMVNVLHIYDGTLTTFFPSAKATIPGNAIVCQGQLVNIVGEVTNGSLQWNLNGVSIPGATSSSYAASQSGSYTVTTSTSRCSKTSNAVSVTVNAVPPRASITAINSDQFPTTYSLTASPSSGYSYQWQLDGTDLPGKTSYTCLAESSGSYTVRLNDSHSCSTMSDPTPITIVPATEVTIGGENSVCINTIEVYSTEQNVPEAITWSVSGGGQILEHVSNNTIKVKWTGPGVVKFNVETTICNRVEDGVVQVCNHEERCDYDYDGHPINCGDAIICEDVVTYHDECSNKIFYAELAVDINGRDNEINWINTRAFDGTADGSGNLKIVGESKSYFDARGQNIQSQTKNFSMGAVFASETIRDQYDRVVGSTLSAPIAHVDFRYCPSAFFLNKDGSQFTYANFSDATLSTETNGTIGNYYSSNNTLETNVPVTDYPYSRTEFYEDGTGEVKRSAGAGDEHRLGKGHEVLSGTFPVYSELDDYLTMRRNAGQVNYRDNLTSVVNNGVQSVVRDQNGKYAISITDKAGKTIMSARLGTSDDKVLTVTNTISSSGDPASTDYRPMTYFYILQPQTVSITGSTDFVVEDIINNVKKNPGQTFADATKQNKWPIGFYRILLNNTTSAIQLSYTHYLADVSYQFYDDAGRLKTSVSPNGYMQLKKNPDPIDFTDIDKTTYQYNHQGWLLSMTEPDAGTTNYKYRKDGKIRFSQNAQQLANETSNATGKGKFSYTNYDALGRPYESGEYIGAQTFSSTSTQVESGSQVQYATTDKKDWARTYYDVPDADFQTTTGLPSDYVQNFVRSAVSHTTNANNHTWYSYDEMGRVTWMAQRPAGLPRIFVVKYSYDFLGNVLTVSNLSYNLSGTLQEQFYHYYEYDKDKRLSKAYTSSKADGTKQLRADYQYYLHGPLKRIVLGDKLQGLDFVYNINGWLTQINHPDKTQDPGHDGTANGVKEDVFGMVLDYYESDLSGLLVSDAKSNMHDPMQRHHLPTGSYEAYAAHQPLIRFASPDSFQGENVQSFKKYGAQNPGYKAMVERTTGN